WERLALQMQIYALNTATSNAFCGGKRGGIGKSTASMRSSPSHYRGNHGLRRRERSQDLRPEARVPPPPRIEHTQPRDTSSELSSGGETAGKSKAGEHSSDPQCYAPRPPRWDESADDEDDADIDDGEWIDEDVGGMEGIADELLQLEFHTDYVGNPEKSLLCATNTTLVLLVAPSHTGELHSVASCAVRRDSSLHDATDMVGLRSAFAELTARRRASCSSDARKEDLRCALDTTVGSLHALGSLYERREMQWIEKKHWHRLDEDKDKVQLLLKQELGVGVVGNLVDRSL
ncbi:hypothetical protein V8E53_013268, partial [Lactarius tabidus]